ncbi:MAG: hypothetical protein ABI134_22485, partial [Byssovorax sp.]
MSITSLGAACGAAFLLALVACEFIRDFAARRALVDLPNERSLHSLPVPRLGAAGGPMRDRARLHPGHRPA